MLRRLRLLVAVSVAIVGLGTQSARAADLPLLNVTVFAAPSQSIWIPTLIQKTGLDQKHGFKLGVTPKPANVAYQDFASGADRICYCASVSAVARFVEQGAKISLLWNIFDYDYYVVTADPKLTKTKDLEGHTLMTDTVTGSWAMGSWLLQSSGLDLSKVQIQSASTVGATGLAQLVAGRVDAVGANPTEASSILKQDASLHSFSVFDKTTWAKYSDAPALPSIAFATWADWLADPANVDLAQRFYAANLDAVAYIRANPEKAAELISAGTKIPQAVLVDIFKRYPQLIDIRPISDYRGAIKVLTQQLLPRGKQLDRPLTDDELKLYVSDFKP